MTISPDQKPISSGFGMHTPAADIVANIDLTGKKAIVTGGYSGIGLETTKALASVGAKVIVPVRSKEKAAAALSDVEGDVTSAPMDLGDLNSVKTFANDFLGVHQKLDILINNAGVMACPETRVGPNWEAQIATNHFGHFALFQHLSPALEAANGARVVALSSTAHKISPIRFDDMHFTQDDYNKWVAYGQSKTADALFAIGVDARLKEKGVRAFAVHPGGILTPLQRHLPKEEMIALGWLDENGELGEQAKAMFKSPAAGAATSVWCAVSPQLDGVGGVYCEDCDIAKVSDEDSPRWAHVMPYAIDPQTADRLWAETEKQLAAA